jgi:hypothetical protein
MPPGPRPAVAVIKRHAIGERGYAHSYRMDYSYYGVWVETPKWHPRRVMFKQNWRRMVYGVNVYQYDYANDIEMAMWGLRQQAGVPDTAEYVFD